METGESNEANKYPATWGTTRAVPLLLHRPIHTVHSVSGYSDIQDGSGVCGTGRYVEVSVYL